jgi:hypothetical protein
MTAQDREALERLLRYLSELEDVQRAICVAARLSSEHLQTMQMLVIDLIAPIQGRET